MVIEEEDERTEKRKKEGMVFNSERRFGASVLRVYVSRGYEGDGEGKSLSWTTRSR